MLMHQLPPKPDYVRVKIRRRLEGIGAVQLKATVYVLPASEEALEDAHWLIGEIRSLGGTAVLCCTEFLDGVTDEEIEARQIAAASTAGRAVAVTKDRVEPGSVWVTREGVKIDRIASSWLIRRFIDRQARFKFVPSRGYRPRTGERRFDMFEAEYTHEGERCTFQTLIVRFGLADRALSAIGEIVHDIDCKDALYGRPETAGIDGLIRGIVASTDDDDDRIARGSALFDDLYRSMRGRRAPAG